MLVPAEVRCVSVGLCSAGVSTGVWRIRCMEDEVHGMEQWGGEILD